MTGSVTTRGKVLARRLFLLLTLPPHEESWVPKAKSAGFFRAILKQEDCAPVAPEEQESCSDGVGM